MNEKHELQSINVMMQEYSTLRDELMKVHSRQQYNVIQGLVVIGALFAFIVANWSDAYNFLVFFALISGLPLCCFTVVLTAASTYARGRQIGYYIAELELKVSHSLKHETENEYNHHQALNFMNWYFRDNNKPKRTLLRFDLATMIMFFLLVAASAVFLSSEYLVTVSKISNHLSYMLPYIIIDLVLLIMYSYIAISSIIYIKREAKSTLSKNYDTIKKMGEEA